MIELQQRTPPASLRALADAVTESLYIREEHVLHRVHRDSILYLQAAGNYVELHTTGRRFVLRTSMSDLMNQLHTVRFGQISRQVAVNLQHLVRVDRDVVEVNGRSLALSRSYRAALIDQLHLLG